MTRVGQTRKLGSLWAPRLLGPRREIVAMGAGLTAWIGLVLMGSYEFFKSPSVMEQGFDPQLNGVEYDISRWPLTLGRAMFAAGAAAAAIIWFCSRPWRPSDRGPSALGTRATRAVRWALLASFVAGTVVPVILVRVVARR